MTLSTLWASPSATGHEAAANPGVVRRPALGRAILYGVLAVVSVGTLAVVPMACQSGGVGDPCTPEDEYNPQFTGFKVQQENIESRSFQCQTRVCLVNHFQGRVSCPQGQPAPKGCTTDSQCNTAKGEKCVESQIYAPTCNVCNSGDPNCMPVPCPSDGNGNPLICDMTRQVCTCTTSNNSNIDGVNYVCEPSNPNDSSSPQVLRAKTCHIPGNCQTADDGTSANNQVNGVPKDCCVPGTDTPVAVSVCGQCNASSKRDAAQAVYCTCRCCAPCCPPSVTTEQDANAQGCSLDMTTCGPACDPNFNYCSCPSGFSCTTIRQNVGLGDAQLAGAYCIKQDTAFDTATNGANCGQVTGYATLLDQSCEGMGTVSQAAATGM